MKKFLSIILSLAMVFSLSSHAFAAEPVNDQEPLIVIDLDKVDPTKPFTQTIQVGTESEPSGTLTLTCTPKPQTRGSSTNEAYESTWTSSYTGINNMSYQFDLEKVGDQWKMSNPRNHTYSRLFTTFSNPSLKISRAISTNSFPCEINASVTAELFDNQWVSLGTSLWYMYTTVTHDGIMTLYW
jgi:hypothetical protein